MDKSLHQPSKRVCLGRIAAPHGIKGLVKILPYGEDPFLIELVSEYKITLKNPMGKYMLAAIEGVDDRNASEALTGTELYIDRDQLPEIDEDGTFYIEDLKGMKAVDEDGNEIGFIKSVDNYGAGDLLEVQPKSGESFYVPFDDEYVGDIDEAVTLKNYSNLVEAS